MDIRTVIRLDSTDPTRSPTMATPTTTRLSDGTPEDRPALSVVGGREAEIRPRRVVVGEAGCRVGVSRWTGEQWGKMRDDERDPHAFRWDDDWFLVDYEIDPAKLPPPSV